MTIGDQYNGDPLGRAFHAQGLLPEVRRQLAEARQTIDRQVREITRLRDLLAVLVELAEGTPELDELRIEYRELR